MRQHIQNTSQLQSCSSSLILLRTGWLKVSYQQTHIRCTSPLNPCMCSLRVNKCCLVQALFDLEATNQDFKTDLRDLYISSAQLIDVTPSKNAIIIHVPYRLLKGFQKIQQRLVRELEKKFSGKDVVLVANRRIMPKTKSGSSKARPRSRTLTSVRCHLLFMAVAGVLAFNPYICVTLRWYLCDLLSLISQLGMIIDKLLMKSPVVCIMLTCMPRNGSTMRHLAG